MSEDKKVIIYTDGACLGNPGPGGYGVVLLSGGHRKEISGGFRLTTNNRMELLAVIKGLEMLKERVQVEVVTDYRYIVDAFQKGWVTKWLSNGWQSSTGDVKNRDLWEQLVALEQQHAVTWQWVKGHSGHADNEKVDALAQAQALQGRSA